jgi:hypothetical protein
MRKSGGPLDEGYKQRILGFCFDPIVTDHRELVESLSAVSSEEAWKTYLWLDYGDNEGQEANANAMVYDFVEAKLLEISGKKQESLEKFRKLKHDLGSHEGKMGYSVDDAIARLSHP